MYLIKRVLFFSLQVILGLFLPVAVSLFIGFKIGYKKGFEAPPMQKLTTTCDRLEPYPLDPVLSQAFDLVINQYQKSDSFSDQEKQFYISIKNCVFVNYEKLTSANSNTTPDGQFKTRNSSLQKLSLYVSEEYKNPKYSSFERATILVHEMTHAKQFYENVRLGISKKEIDKEVEAFKQEWKFFMSLDKKTRENLISRASSFSSNAQLRSLNSFIKIHNKSLEICQNEPEECYWREFDRLVKESATGERGYKDDTK